MNRKSVRTFILCAVIISFFAAVPAFSQELKHNITDKAELKSISMQIKNIRSESKVKMVVFDLVVKNISDKPLRYNAMIYIPGKGSGADAIPEKADQTIPPGGEMKGSVAVLTEEFPTSFSLEIIEE